MERSIRVQALVLSHQNYGEADRFVRLLTPDRGKLSALAKGVRKMASRKAGHLEPFTCISAQLSRGKGSAWIVGQVSTTEGFPNLTCTLLNTCHAAYVSELADRFSAEEVSNAALYRLTLETFRRLSAGGDPFVILRYFEFRLLDLTGYRPQLQQCVDCGAEIQPEAQFFSQINGGVVCPTCFNQRPEMRAGLLPVSMRTLKYMRFYQQRSFSEAAAAGWPEDLRKEAETLLTTYLTGILERRINSQVFLNNIRANNLNSKSGSGLQQEDR